MKKIYAELNQAHNAAFIKYGPVDTWFKRDHNDGYYMSVRYFERLTKFLQTKMTCDNNYKEEVDCMTSKKKELSSWWIRYSLRLYVYNFIKWC